VTEPMTTEEADPAELLRLALDLSCDDQHMLATRLAANVGYELIEAQSFDIIDEDRTPLNAIPIVTGSELLTREEAESVYNALRHPLGITQFTGHSITLIREAVNIVLSARIPLYTQPQSQRIAELEAALKPFAVAAARADKETELWGLDREPSNSAVFGMGLKFGDLRVARDAFQGKSK
jgi:hypothetical protein